MKAQVKKYDPTQYNFENFANTMNKNYAIERSQKSQGGAFGAPTMPGNVAVHADNPINLGSATNSQTLGNFGFNSILSGFKKNLDGYSLGKQMGVNESLGAGVNGSAATTLINQKTESPRAVKTVETPTVTQGDVKESFDLSWLDALESGLNPVSKLSFEEWQSAYSVNPAEEYKYAQAQLDYEFKTWMSDYGARAEQLYQMGLSNSGVSDVFGANAYSAYIQSSMELKREQIKLEQDNKKNYQAYLDELETAANTRISSAFTSYMSAYTPENAQMIYNGLIGQGMSAEEAAKTIRRLDEYYNKTPEDSRPDAVAANAKVDEAVTWLNSNYAYGMTDDELSKMLTSTYGAEVAQAALAKFAPFKEVIDRLSGDEAAKNAFSAMIDMLEAGDTDLESLKAKAKGLGYSDDAIAKAAENILPFVQDAEGNKEKLTNDAAVRLVTTLYTDSETGASTYTGSESQKNYIRKLVQLDEYSSYAPYVEQIIEKMDENLASTKQAAATDIGNEFKETAKNESWLSDPATSTMANYSATLAQYKQDYDINSKEYRDILAAGSATIKDYILKATDDEAMLEEASAWLGEDFTGKDVADKINAMLDGAGRLHKDGYMTNEDYREIINEWLGDQIELSIDSGKQAFWNFANKAGRLQEYLDAGYMSEYEYSSFINRITDNFDIEVENVKSFTYSGVTDYTLVGNIKVGDTTIQWNADVKPIASTLALYDAVSPLFNNSTRSFAIYDGEIICKSAQNEYYVIKTNNSMTFTGDGKTNTEEAKTNMVNLIRAWVSQKGAQAKKSTLR